MQATRFDCHGDYSLTAENRLLVIHASSAWNKEHSLAFVNDCKCLITATLAPHTFYVLTCTSDWLPTHDSLAILRELTHWSIEQGMRAQAFCFSNQLEIEVLTQKIVPQDNERFVRRGFMDESEAREWLSSMARMDGHALVSLQA
ncbi:hypothetical protein [Alteromonas flava]|uniref:hypothetical protein n=1 Tax=Alteromonas flava TaxID=2048003 RepID=UPI000C28D3BD|nr:hypothetical protein [Alteromonas flava]